MGLEIERKWLISPQDLPFSLERLFHRHIEQAYICFKPQIRLRSFDGEQFVLTVKGRPANDVSGLVREECEYALDADTYERLCAKVDGKTLRKTRYVIAEDDARAAEGLSAVSSERVFEIDLYEGDHAGLAVVEMEFSCVEDAQDFKAPSWVLEEVTGDPRFSNVVMAQL